MYAFMDEDICQDKFFHLSAPILLTGTLEGLQKPSILDMNIPVEMAESSGKWSILNA